MNHKHCRLVLRWWYNREAPSDSCMTAALWLCPPFVFFRSCHIHFPVHTNMHNHLSLLWLGLVGGRGGAVNLTAECVCVCRLHLCFMLLKQPWYDRMHAFFFSFFLSFLDPVSLSHIILSISRLATPSAHEIKQHYFFIWSFRCSFVFFLFFLVMTARPIIISRCSGSFWASWDGLTKEYTTSFKRSKEEFGEWEWRGFVEN